MYCSCWLLWLCADVSASSVRSSSSSPVALDESMEEAIHIVEESLHERAMVSRVKQLQQRQMQSELCWTCRVVAEAGHM